ncbi:MAG: DUF4129 domain-containing protein [Anaerolineales bacterium]
MSFHRSDRRLTLIYAAAAILGVAALTSVISGIELRSGLRLPIGLPSGPLDPSLGQSSDPPAAILHWIALIARFVFFVLLPPSLLYLIVSPSARRRVLFQVLSLLFVSYLVLSISPSLRAQTIAPPPPQAAGAEAAEPTSAPVDVIPPRWLIVGISSVVALGLLAAGYWMVRRARKVADPRIGELRHALQTLEHGTNDLESVVFHAYRTLCEVSEERKGIRKRPVMTPREFQATLEKAALPSDPLAKLTSLFERARYGQEKLSQEDERVASAALRSILQEIEQA